MDKDREAVKLCLQAEIKDSILGMIGERDVDQCLGIMMCALNIAENLRIDDTKLTITLKELKKARDKYLASESIIDDTD